MSDKEETKKERRKKINERKEGIAKIRGESDGDINLEMCMKLTGNDRYYRLLMLTPEEINVKEEKIKGEEARRVAYFKNKSEK